MQPYESDPLHTGLPDGKSKEAHEIQDLSGLAAPQGLHQTERVAYLLQNPFSIRAR